MLAPGGLPTEIRNMLLVTIIQSGLVGPNAVNAVWLVYAIISLIIAQQIIKAVMGVPLSSETEPADVDFLFPAPIKGRVFYTAKYLRSIPRRLTFFGFAILALQPVLWLFGIHQDWLIPLWPVIIFMVVAFMLSEIGSVATQGLYAARKIISRPRPFRRIYRVLFYVTLSLGTFLLLTPLIMMGGTIMMSPMYNLAYMMVALGSGGRFATLYPPAIPFVILGLLITFVTILVLTRFLSDRVTIDLYEEIAAIARKRGAAVGVLSRLRIKFRNLTTPLQSIMTKDFVSGIRKPGKAFFLFGIITNFIFAIIFISLLPTLREVLPLPPSFIQFMGALYAILLVVIIPLLAITASDPFQGEYGTLYLIRLAPVAPLRFTLIKYAQLLLTPTLLSIPFSIYFAVILGQLELLPIALAILPHAILLSTAIGVGLGSRYPYASRAKKETPIALMITFPLLSWIAILPVLIFQLGFLPAGVGLMLLSSLFVVPYTGGLVLILLGWSAHSFLRQE